MKKTTLAVWGVANIGKSQTIKSVYDLLLSKYPKAKQEHVIDGKDVRAVVTINGKKIGIESQGDPNSRLFESLELFVKVKCQVIVCATRTRGATVTAVESLETNYDVIWYEKESVNGSSAQTKINLTMAKKLVNEIEKLIA